MKQLIHIIFVLVFVLTFNACQQDFCFTKEQFLETYGQFIHDLESQKEGLTIEEKAKFETRFQNIVEECYKKYKPEMTLKEKQDFWKSSVKYYFAKEGGNININISSKEKSDFEKYVETEISDVIKDSGATFLSSFENILEDKLPSLLDNIANELKKLAVDLEENLDNN